MTINIIFFPSPKFYNPPARNSFYIFNQKSLNRLMTCQRSKILVIKVPFLILCYIWFPDISIPPKKFEPLDDIWPIWIFWDIFYNMTLNIVFFQVLKFIIHQPGTIVIARNSCQWFSKVCIWFGSIAGKFYNILVFSRVSVILWHYIFIG